MKLSLEELLQQKALVEKQLAWLEAKIAQVKSETGASSASTSPAPTNTPVQRVETKPVESAQTTESSEIAGAPAQATGVTTVEKVGCIVAAVIICLIPLFLLFVLPHWLYPDGEEENENQDAIEQYQE